MHTEIEATFLDVNHNTVRSRLEELGGTCKSPQYTMKRAIYDYPDLRLDKQAAWVRVRHEGDKVTMGFKQRRSETIEGMREVEVNVSDYDESCEFLEAIGLKEKARQETKRELWQLDDCEIMLEEWPWIPKYIEVEGPSEASVRKVSERLGFDYASALFDSADAIYQKYYDVTRTEISTVPITFGPVPAWLEKKRRG